MAEKIGTYFSKQIAIVFCYKMGMLNIAKKEENNIHHLVTKMKTGPSPELTK